MLIDVYNSLMADPFISEEATGGIKFYEFPEASSLSEPHIIIDPLDVPRPKVFADNTWLKTSYFYQIDVWSKSMDITDRLAEAIQNVMWANGYSQKGGPKEWDKDYNVFRDARRYEAELYRNLK